MAIGVKTMPVNALSFDRYIGKPRVTVYPIHTVIQKNTYCWV